MTEREKLGKGLWYDANYDEELLKQREDAEELCLLLNQTSPKMKEKKEEILTSLFPHRGKETAILSPIYADYGFHCFIGDYTFINHNAYLMDCAPITIGSDTVIGAGSVVTRDIPSHVVAIGNPCHVLREITEKDSIYNK